MNPALELDVGFYIAGLVTGVFLFVPIARWIFGRAVIFDPPFGAEEHFVPGQPERRQIFYLEVRDAGAGRWWLVRTFWAGAKVCIDGRRCMIDEELVAFSKPSDWRITYVD